ncbi:MAG: hypothetical protein IKH26_09920 [Bacteroidaceae bacterium]|nr:hypothetical protein [Bacteroidaceae bacterium]
MKRILLLLAMAFGAMPLIRAEISVQTAVCDVYSQPPIVGGIISGTYDTSVLKKGILVNVSKSNLFYNGNAQKAFPFYWNSQEVVNANYTKGLIIDCTSIGKEQFWCPLQFLKPNTDYHVRAYAIREDGSIVYGQIKTVHSINVNRYNGHSDYANVFHAFDYTLFDLITDEIIYPNKGFYYSTNESPRIARTQIGNNYNTCYKFKTEWNYKLWYYHSIHCQKDKIVNVPLLSFTNNKLLIQKNPFDANKDITIYYSINGNYFRPETFTNVYSNPIEINKPCTVYCYAKSSYGYISYTNMYVINRLNEDLDVVNSGLSNESQANRLMNSKVKVSYKQCPDGNHPHMIDLGLPTGTLWACCNVGATKQEECGSYFAWGETKEYDGSTYLYYDDGYIDIGYDIAGTKYDVAHVKWGGSWRMPTLDQIKELLENCTSEWRTVNSVYGREFAGPNGGKVFLPAAGRQLNGLDNLGISGDYWSSTLSPEGNNLACFLYFDSDDHLHWYDVNYRDYGHCVRPVSK